MFKRVVFLHPDLGIGGAERLVVDAALAVKQKGYGVQIVTNHYDSAHCFEETMTKDMNITVVGEWLPRSICGRMLALCAYLRMFVGALYVLFTCNNSQDVIFVDQISIPLPLLYFSKFKTVFYCHFPDQLLTERQTWYKRFYRLPIDYLEEWATGFADQIVANSNFTASVVHRTFPSLKNRNLQILYPISNAVSLQLPESVLDGKDASRLSGNRILCRKAMPGHSIPPTARFVFVSLNRYERKKNLQLTLFALSHLFLHWSDLIDSEKSEHAEPHHVHLVIAGGYDSRVVENVDYHEDLVHLAEELKLSDRVTFIRSCPSDTKALLIAASDAVLYTPDKEHFGIVPVEAMLMCRPVIALDSGGPRETVVDGTTGYLCSADIPARLPQLFAERMARFLNDPALVARMGRAAHRHVLEKFSFRAFRTHLSEILSNLHSS